MRVRLEVRRFVCRTRGCPRITFAERFPTLTRTYARRTLRQADALVEVAFAVGGKAGAQLAKRLAMPTSRDTLLRLIHSTDVPQRKTPQVLGLDDFAWKKGDRYGTLLVDLQAHCPVEVLASSRSRHRRPLAACTSGRENHQSGSCRSLCGGSHTRRAASQASR